MSYYQTVRRWRSNDILILLEKHHA
jgi:hypothetical protein